MKKELVYFVVAAMAAFLIGFVFSPSKIKIIENEVCQEVFVKQIDERN